MYCHCLNADQRDAIAILKSFLGLKTPTYRHCQDSELSGEAKTQYIGPNF